MSLTDEKEKQMLHDIYLAVCGDPNLGVPGLVDTVRANSADIKNLKDTRSAGVVLGKFGSIVLGLLVSLSFLGCFIVAVWEAIKK